MKNCLLLLFISIGFTSWAQKGYEIKVTLKPFKNQYIYLGHYAGTQLPVVDSVLLNEKSQGVFKKDTVLGGGIYLISYPSKDKFIEILVDEHQQFEVVADTAHYGETVFHHSPDNVLFAAYHKEINRLGTVYSAAQKKAATATNPKDSVQWNEEMKQAGSAMTTYRQNLLQKNPHTLLSALLHLMEEPKVPPAAEHPGGKYDSSYAWYYYKSHYWDGINFWDDRIMRTPASLFDARIDKYFNTVVYPQPDSVNKEIDWMLGYASVSKDLTRYLLIKFINRYMNMKYMWEDAVLVNLYQKYFAQTKHDWLTEKGEKMIRDRAYNVMANIMGNPAENIALMDAAGKIQLLYADTSRFMIVCFWDPTCGHCKEVLPKIDSMYKTKWKDIGLHIYAVGKETDGTQKQWLDFIQQYNLQEGWTHVYNSREEEKKRTDSGIPGYTQLYDAQTVPALYLLDREKRIIAKKMGWEQIDEILQLKLK